MKTIYLDHNLARYYVKGFPKSFDRVAEHSSLEAAIALHPEVRFAVSDWNVVEAARECAGAPNPRALAGDYATFFERLRPVFIEGHNTLQRAELGALALAYWQRPAAHRAADWMFASHFAQVASSRIPEVLVGLSLRIYLRHLATTPSSLASFDAPVETARWAMMIGIDAYNAGALKDLTLQARIDRDWLLSLLPERDGEGAWIDIATRRALADAWSAEADTVIARCPTLAVESALAELRAAAGSRKPKNSDTFDLMHAVPALAYCDAFVSNDGPLRKQAVIASLKAQLGVIVASSVSEALTRLAAKG